MPLVTLVPTRQSFAAEADETVLDAALRAGLNLPHSCKGGHCGSCRARVLRGRFAYPRGRTAGITEAEAAEGYALLCSAHARSDLEVETREVRPAPDVEVKSLPCRIDRLTRIADDVMSVTLRLPAVEEFHFRPGQYLDVMSGARAQASATISTCRCR